MHESKYGINFHDSQMYGAAKEFSRVFSEGLEPPQHFFYLAYLTCLGAAIGHNLRYEGRRNKDDARLYTLILGESEVERKSTANNETMRFFDEALGKGKQFKRVGGIGSAEGLVRGVEGTDSRPGHEHILLHYDEFSSLVAKSKVTASVLVQTLSSLFHATEYENLTKADPIYIEKIHLSMLAATTIDTYQHIDASSEFFTTGLINRLFVVPGRRTKSIPDPKEIPESKLEPLREQLRRIVSLASEEIHITTSKAADCIHDFWYQCMQSGPESKRLDAYFKRLQALIAISMGETEVGDEAVAGAFYLVAWQRRMRKIYAPYEGQTQDVKCQNKILRKLHEFRSLSYRELSRKITPSTVGGVKVLRSNLDALKTAGELVFKDKVYSLPEGDCLSEK